MNLPFNTIWPDTMPEHMAGKPTYFPEKIWDSISPMIADEEYHKWHGGEGLLNLNMGNNFDDSVFNEYNPKIHAIRRDSGNRWKPGNEIDFWINYRTKKQFRFAPRTLVMSVQEIKIIYPKRGGYYVVIDGRAIYYKDELNILAKNDGFDSLEEFFAWFNGDFTGKIIHWTDFKY